MELAGKKIAFLGDSITEGHGTSDRSRVFWRILGERTGAQVYGYGVGGTRIAPQQHVLDWEQGSYFETRVEEMIPDADIVVVFGGTNDFGHGDAPFGTIMDEDKRTFCGALHSLCRTLIHRYPAAQLVILTPTHRSSEEDGPYNEIGVRLSADLRGYVDAIIEIAGFYSIPVLDLYRVCGIQPRVETLKQRYMPDGLHPNDAGHERIAEKLIGFLKSL